MNSTRSKMGGSKQQKRKSKSTKSHRGIRKPKGMYLSLADRFSFSPEGEKMEVPLTRKPRKHQLDFSNIIEGRRTRTQTAMGNQYRQMQATAHRRSVTRHHRKKLNDDVDELTGMFGQSAHLGV